MKQDAYSTRLSQTEAVFNCNFSVFVCVCLPWAYKRNSPLSIGVSSPRTLDPGDALSWS